jgi:UDP-2-acetamido-2,6-beta-L-arabino-hexul-4-ose reductase
MIADGRRIAVTGASGFLGTSLVVRLNEQGREVRRITRDTDSRVAAAELACADVIFHLAGANRADDESDFMRSNRDYTAWVAAAGSEGQRKPLIVYSSSARALDDSAYGRSKKAGEDVLLDVAEQGLATVSIWRLPNLCGKWARPNYNSAVATFCHYAARGLPLSIDDSAAPLSLLYVEDLIEDWLRLIDKPPAASGFAELRNVHQTTVGEVAELIRHFAERRSRGEICDVGTALTRTLYGIFIAALPVEKASYPVVARQDARGSFVEMLKNPVAGQFSYFTAHPGITRGGHYHHSKVEKFLVAHGTGRFRFRHVLTGAKFELTGSAADPLVVETIPGWAHDVTNIGDNELIVLCWANEQFDPDRPDTYPLPL